MTAYWPTLDQHVLTNIVRVTDYILGLISFSIMGSVKHFTECKVAKLTTSLHRALGSKCINLHDLSMVSNLHAFLSINVPNPLIPLSFTFKGS